MTSQPPQPATAGPDAPDGPGAAEQLRATTTARDRNLVVRRIKAALAGSGARARERDAALVISDPRHPGSRVHVRYADGSVSVERTSWDFLGYLKDYKDHDHPDDETVSIAYILSRLEDPDACRHP